MTQQQTTVRGIGIPGILGVAFVVLKLCGVIDWSWWWVTIPFWGLIAVLGSFALICFIVAGILSLFEPSKGRKR